MTSTRNDPRPHDDALLVALGYQPHLKRTLRASSLLGMAFAILNSWVILSSSLAHTLPSGGSSSALWGLLVTGCCHLCVALSMSEFLSAYPTAGGQYYWVAAITPEWCNAFASWVTGCFSVVGWLAVAASGAVLGSQLLIAIIDFSAGGLRTTKVQYFSVYVLWILTSLVFNLVAGHMLSRLNQAAFIYSITGLIIISLVTIISTGRDFAAPASIFQGLLNRTGWPAPVAWILGTLQSCLSLIGYDAVSHMVEEIPNPTRSGPVILIACVAIGTVTGFAFLLIILMASGSVDSIEKIVSSPTHPLIQILQLATANKFAVSLLLLFPLFSLLFGTIGIMTTSSRLIYAFARDGGLPFSSQLAHLSSGTPDATFPANALYSSASGVLLLGALFLFSEAVFNAIASASVIALQVSYVLPIVMNVAQKRKRLPSTRAFVLGDVVGWFVNIVSIGYVVASTPFFLLPPQRPVTWENMNYSCVILTLVFAALITFWSLGYGRMRFQLPPRARPNTNDDAESRTPLINS